MVSDEELYRRYVNGDETGLDELMKKYGNPLTMYINGYLQDVHEAEDLMIEFFPICLRKSPTYGMED
ncbi:MAG: RNA polymerase sigma factor [Suilimivivens sp.]